ncbi:hypothetical protein D3870_08670 [Noviherbaspirillum cavernae]|uniref:Transposase IS701-like DDE domain-containing protein n=1 Tax=Noviherbaspirillum cavernae TaxID=2320862 RepID=A0A418X0X5_9BURK|nr:hypothetical protein D3870_08670 [Noviherbaspirillum cavernae]
MLCLRLLLVAQDAHRACWRRTAGPSTSRACAALQFFLPESTWEVDAITARTLQLRGADPLTASTADGVLVIDDTGDRKDGCATDHVARQYLGSVGKIDNGIVAVTTRKTLRSRPSRKSPCPWSSAHRRPALRSRRSWPIAFTAITTRSKPFCGSADYPLC